MEYKKSSRGSDNRSGGNRNSSSNSDNRKNYGTRGGRRREESNSEYSKNEVLELTITDVGSDGEGVGKVDNFTYFVKDAIPGDVIKAKVTKAKKNYAFARVEEIITPSEDRVQPRCKHHKVCGGCQIQAMSYERQLTYKQNKIYNNLLRIGGVEEQVIKETMEPIVGMKEPYRYRNKAQYPFGTDKFGKTITGFYAERSHNIISNTECYLGVEENKEILEIILKYMEEKGITSYNETDFTGNVRHVLIRKGFTSGEIMVCLVLNMHQTTWDRETRVVRALKSKDFIDRLCKVKGMTSISVNLNTRRDNVIMGHDSELLWGKSVISDTIHVRDVAADFACTGEELTFHISPLSFYQINPEQTEKLYSIALDYANLTGKETVWDLYCGIGTISLFLAQKAGKVYGVEVIEPAILDARENAIRNGITNTEFFVGEAEVILPEKYKEENIYADVIVVDPPRKGCDQTCLDTMIEMKPKRIVYVSCDSATLARDVKILREGGYEIVKWRGVDQFGHTSHTECVVLLQRRLESI